MNVVGYIVEISVVSLLVEQQLHEAPDSVVVVVVTDVVMTTELPLFVAVYLEIGFRNKVLRYLLN